MITAKCEGGDLNPHGCYPLAPQGIEAASDANDSGGLANVAESAKDTKSQAEEALRGAAPQSVHERRRLYFVWRKMVARCHDWKDAGYPNYGARGISVWSVWRASFQCFLDDMAAGWRPGLELDRINNDGHYEPGNVRWATHKQNQANTRKTRLIEAFGEKLPLREWARRTGIPHRTIARRLDAGTPPETALTQRSA